MRQVVETDDAHVTVTPSDKTTGPTQSSSVSSGFTSKMLNIEDISPNLESVFESQVQPSTSLVISTTPLQTPATIPTPTPTPIPTQPL